MSRRVAVAGETTGLEHRPGRTPRRAAEGAGTRLTARTADLDEGVSWSSPLAPAHPSPPPRKSGVLVGRATITQPLVEGEPPEAGGCGKKGASGSDRTPTPNVDRPWHPLLRKFPAREEDWESNERGPPAGDRERGSLPALPGSPHPPLLPALGRGLVEQARCAAAQNLSTHCLPPRQRAFECGTSLPRLPAPTSAWCPSTHRAWPMRGTGNSGLLG